MDTGGADLASPGLRVLLIDRHQIARASIRRLLLSEARVRAVDEAGGLREWLGTRGTSDPDVVVLGGSDPAPILAIATAAPTARIVVLGLEDDPNYARRALSAGASAYVRRDQANDELLSALRVVVAGGTYPDARDALLTLE
jgi:DNA-binding NarL/FixJ family response regulator